MNANIFLIGMPGVGKSTVGKVLAHRLNHVFVDADEELVRRNGVDIATIFEIEGEAGFREREAALLSELCLSNGIVLATGGGAILHPASRALLRQRGTVIYLRASIDELARRTLRSHKRPLLRTEDPRAQLERLLSEREVLYNETANLVFDSSVGSIVALTDRILGALHQRL